MTVSIKKKARNAAKDTLFLSLQAVYNRYRALPVDPDKVLFVEYRAARPSDNFTLLMQTLRRMQPEKTIHFHTLLRGSVSELEFIRRSRCLLKDMADASWVFLCEGNEVVSCVEKRPETKVIQLWHACGAFKRFGLSTVDLPFGPDQEGMRRHPYYRNVDLVPVSSEEVSDCYVEAMGLTQTPQVVRALGVSRTDRFYDPAFLHASRAQIAARYPRSAGKKLVLYAPTFRGKPSEARAPVLPDLCDLHEILGEECFFLIKQHPLVQTPPEIPEELKGTFAVDVTGVLPIETLLAASDLCITDYSSLVFEYSLFERPMIFYAYDLEEYQDWRGFYYSYEEMTPGPVVHSQQELAQAIRTQLISYDPAEISAFRQRFMTACDGHATQRILETLQMMS